MIFCHLTEIVLVLLFRLLLSRENRLRNEKAGIVDEALDLDATAFGDMTDRENPNFRYVY
jgi:hypothetical protein